MKSLKLSIAVLLLAVLAASCVDIENTLITISNLDSISKRVIDSKLDQQDIDCFLEAMRRAEKNPEMDGAIELVNFTVRDVIDEERVIQEEEAVQLARQEKFQEMIETLNSEAEIRYGSGQHFLREVAWVELKAIKRVDYLINYDYKAVLEISTGAPNFSTLNGVKGEAIFTDSFDEELLRVPFEYIGTLNPGKSVEMIIDLSLGSDLGSKIYSEVNKNIKFDFYLSHIVYADGSINKQLTLEESRIEVLRMYEGELKDYFDFDLPSEWQLAYDELRKAKIVL